MKKHSRLSKTLISYGVTEYWQDVVRSSAHRKKLKQRKSAEHKAKIAVALRAYWGRMHNELKKTNVSEK